MTHETSAETPRQLTAEQTLQAGAELLEHFGLEIDPIQEPEKFIDSLRQVEPRYKGGLEHKRNRSDLETDPTKWSDDAEAVIRQAAERMGVMESETPLVGEYDVVIALGGASQSNLVRARYALQAVREGKATVGRLIVAGSSRQLNDKEQAATADYAPGASTEFDLCAAAAGIVAQENPGVAVGVAYVEHIVDGKKANTPTVIETVLRNLKASGALTSDSRVAAITTQIYQRSTAHDMARVAGQLGVTQTASAGSPSVPKVAANRNTTTYLSEILRTLQSATLAAQAERLAQSPEHVSQRADRLRSQIAATWQRSGQLQQALDELDRTHPEQGRYVEEPDGSTTRHEPSGRVWQSRSSDGRIFFGPTDPIGMYEE